MADGEKLLPGNRLEKICGFDVMISAYAPPDFFAIVDGALVAGSIEVAQKVLGRIVWTSPPCFLKSDGTLLQIMTEDEWIDRLQRKRRAIQSVAEDLQALLKGRAQ
jgi:hypothetical protein